MEELSKCANKDCYYYDSESYFNCWNQRLTAFTERDLFFNELAKKCRNFKEAPTAN